MELTQGKQEAPTTSAKSAGTGNAAVLGAAFMAVLVGAGLFYLFITRNQISTDKADIEAPVISVSSATGGVVKKVLVAPGDQVVANEPVAEVGDQVLRAGEPGLVTSADDVVGKTVAPGEAVVTIVAPENLRVVAHIDEDKRLSDIRTGQLVSFTVDAFGSKAFIGIVDEIGPSSRQSGVVFNISDQREIRQFDVKIKYDPGKYPELKNGMSAKVTIFKS